MHDEWPQPASTIGNPGRHKWMQTTQRAEGQLGSVAGRGSLVLNSRKRVLPMFVWIGKTRQFLEQVEHPTRKSQRHSDRNWKYFSNPSFLHASLSCWLLCVQHGTMNHGSMASIQPAISPNAGATWPVQRHHGQATWPVQRQHGQATRQHGLRWRIPEEPFGLVKTIPKSTSIGENDNRSENDPCDQPHERPDINNKHPNYYMMIAPNYHIPRPGAGVVAMICFMCYVRFCYFLVAKFSYVLQTSLVDIDIALCLSYRHPFSF